MKGLFNKVKNGPTRRKYVVSTIRKGPELFETAVFAAGFLFFPRRLSRPVLAVQTKSMDEAWDLHYAMVKRLTSEYPPSLFEEFSA